MTENTIKELFEHLSGVHQDMTGAFSHLINLPRNLLGDGVKCMRDYIKQTKVEPNNRGAGVRGL